VSLTIVIQLAKVSNIRLRRTGEVKFDICLCLSGLFKDWNHSYQEVY